MGNSTGISWTDATWNPIRGCSRVSEGCRHCYAERVAARFSGPGQPYEGLARHKLTIVNSEERDPGNRSEARWTGEVRFVAEHLADPLRWRKPRRIFANSMSDLFHERLTNEQIAAVFGVMAACPQHTFQVLTKRAKRMREWFEWAIDGTARGGFYDATFLNHLTSKAGLRWEDRPKWLAHCEETEDTSSTWPLPNVWLGVSVENQDAGDERIPDLLATPAAVRFLSCEPLLGEVDAKLTGCFHEGAGTPERPDELETHVECAARIDWVIAGCESGPGARPCDVAWLRSLRDQCAAAGVPMFLKQAVDDGRLTMGGEGPPALAMGHDSKRKAGGVIELPYLDGRQHAAFPPGT